MLFRGGTRFQATNQFAELEAVCDGLKVAQEMLVT